MKIVLTGGGTGGHFYPLIAVAEEINRIATERKILPPQLYYIAPTPYDERLLFENNIEFRHSPAGKLRRYFSFLNVIDLVKTLIGVSKALLQLFSIFPDVIFSKGGYSSFPTVTAGHILGIPVVVHESDAKPGRANLLAGKRAQSIALSYPEAADYFPKDKIALVGNPVRRALRTPLTEGAREFLKLEEQAPVILILGGSQGASRINDIILEALPELVQRFQVIHQTGEALFESVSQTASVILDKNSNASRYHLFAYLNELALRMSGGVASLIITRAGSGSLFEIAGWGKPSIVIPIPEEVSHDQRSNAYSYARNGAATVIEEKNLAPHLLLSEINRIMDDAKLQKDMGEAALAFARPDAATKIAEELIRIALLHER